MKLKVGGATLPLGCVFCEKKTKTKTNKKKLHFKTLTAIYIRQFYWVYKNWLLATEDSI